MIVLTIRRDLFRSRIDLVNTMLGVATIGYACTGTVPTKQSNVAFHSVVCCTNQSVRYSLALRSVLQSDRRSFMMNLAL